jgi:hypothetical protein
MARPKKGDKEYQEKRVKFDQLRSEGKSIRYCVEAVPVSKSVAQEWERDRIAGEASTDPHATLRAFLENLVAVGLPEEAARASQVYWRVRLGAPPEGATAWHTEHLAVFVSQPLDVLTPEEMFAELGDEGRALWLEYLAAMGRRAGLLQRDDGTWFADPAQEPPARP